MSPVEPFRTESALRRPALTVLLLITAVLIGERVLTAVVDGAVRGSAAFPAWLPQFGSVGRTVTYYTLVLEFLQFVALPAALMWLAYAYGRYTAPHSATEATEA